MSYKTKKLHNIQQIVDKRPFEAQGHSHHPTCGTSHWGGFGSNLWQTIKVFLNILSFWDLPGSIGPKEIKLAQVIEIDTLDTGGCIKTGGFDQHVGSWLLFHSIIMEFLIFYMMKDVLPSVHIQDGWEVFRIPKQKCLTRAKNCSQKKNDYHSDRTHLSKKYSGGSPGKYSSQYWN